MHRLGRGSLRVPDRGEDLQNIDRCHLRDHDLADAGEGVAFETRKPVPRVLLAAPPGLLLVQHTCGRLGEAGNAPRAPPLGERRVNAVMTPRTEIAQLDLADRPEALAQTIAERPFSRYLVTDGRIDEVVGVVHCRSDWRRCSPATPLPYQPPSRRRCSCLRLPIFDLLERFREDGSHFAVVLNEYGGVEGIVTMGDTVEELVGEVAN